MAMTNINITCNCADGKPLEVLSLLIKRRSDVLHETTQQSCIAIAMTAMKSLRAATRKSNGKIKPIVEQAVSDLDIAVVEAPEYVMSVKTEGGVRKPCVRVGSKRGPIVNLKVVYRIEDKSMLRNAKVFKVTLSDSRLQAWKYAKSPWLMVAKDLQSAKANAAYRYNKLVLRYSGLGRDAWTRAMMLTHSAPISFVNRSDKTFTVLSKNVAVQKNLENANLLGTAGEFYIHVEDNLRYAGDALTGGYPAVNSALMRAANSSNAVINKWIASHDPLHFFNDTMTTPFTKEQIEGNMT